AAAYVDASSPCSWINRPANNDTITATSIRSNRIRNGPVARRTFAGPRRRGNGDGAVLVGGLRRGFLWGDIAFALTARGFVVDRRPPSDAAVLASVPLAVFGVAVARFAALLLPVDFFAAPLFAAGFFAAGFFAAGFFAAGLFAAPLLAAGFLAAPPRD